MDRHHIGHPEQAGREGRCHGVHREVPADGQDGEVRPVQLADEGHVAEGLGVTGVIDAIAVLELDNEAGGLTQVQSCLAAGIPVTGRMVRASHRDPQAGSLDGPALVHADDRV